MKRFISGTVITISLLLLMGEGMVNTAEASTNGYFLNCFCAKSFARGGTLVGIPDNGAVLLANPAGLAFLEGRAIGFGLGVLIPEVQFQNSTNNLTTADRKLYPMPFAGFVNPMHDSRWSWGFGVNVVGGMGAEYKLRHELFKDPSGNMITQEYYSKFGYVKAGPGIAYKLNDNFSIGAGVQLYYGMLDFKMPFSLDPISSLNGVADPGTGATFGQLFAGDPSMGGFGYNEVTAYAAMTGLDGFGFGGNIGLYWQVNDKLSLGFAYNSPSRIKFSGDATMDMTAQLNDAFGRAVQGVMMQDPSLTQEEAQAQVMQMFAGMGIDMSKGVETTYNLSAADFDVPQKLAVGVGVKPNPRLTLGLDVEWINWAAAFDNFPLQFEEGVNENINLMINGDVNNGSFNYDFPLEWKNSFVFKLGADYELFEGTNVRAGFIHGQNPAPDNTVFAIFPAIVENHMTLGFGHKFGAYEIDLAYVHAFNKTQDAVASDHLVASEYNGSTNKLSEDLIVMSFAIGL